MELVSRTVTITLQRKDLLAALGKLTVPGTTMWGNSVPRVKSTRRKSGPWGIGVRPSHESEACLQASLMCWRRHNGAPAECGPPDTRF